MADNETETDTTDEAPDFDKAFDDFTAPEKGDTPDTDDTPEDDITAEADEGEGDTDEDAVDDADGDADEVTDSSSDGDEPDDTADDGDDGDDGDEDASPPSGNDDVLERLSKLVADADKARGDVVTDSNKKPAEGDEKEESFYSDDETAFLADYEKEWEDVSRGEALKRRAEYNQLVSHIFSEVQKYYAPIEQTMRTLAERAQLSDLSESIPDYSDNLREDVTSWVEKQPAYLQGAYKQVIQSGTVEEVTDLVNRYREATGVAKGAPKKPTKKEPELSDAAKKAAGALAPVSSKRGAVPKDDDKSNFDDAFSKFSEELKNL